VPQGLEYLVAHALQWEEVAASHVSLEPHLGEVSKLILRWRKLELLSWPHILAQRVQVHEMDSMKWWFHFQLLLDSGASVPPSESETFIGQAVDNIIAFVQAASVGDFRARLAILASFADQLELECVAGLSNAQVVCGSGDRERRERERARES
jgi:midasin